MSRHPINDCSPSPRLVPPGKKAIKLSLKINLPAHIYEVARIGKCTETESRMEISEAAAEWGEAGSYCLTGYGGSVSGDGKVQEMRGDDRWLRNTGDTLHAV